MAQFVQKDSNFFGVFGHFIFESELGVVIVPENLGTFLAKFKSFSHDSPISFTFSAIGFIHEGTDRFLLDISKNTE